MKRTISEVIDLIKQKKESAESKRIEIYNSNIPFMDKFADVNKYMGYYEAYTDILALLETSHLIEQEKALDILKKAFDISVEEIYTIGYQLLICEKNSYESVTGEITEEEYDLLKEVLDEQE